MRPDLGTRVGKMACASLAVAAVLSLGSGRGYAGNLFQEIEQATKKVVGEANRELGQTEKEARTLREQDRQILQPYKDKVEEAKRKLDEAENAVRKVDNQLLDQKYGPIMERRRNAWKSRNAQMTIYLILKQVDKNDDGMLDAEERGALARLLSIPQPITDAKILESLQRYQGDYPLGSDMIKERLSALGYILSEKDRKDLQEMWKE